jgi:hypothetical protein
MLWVDQVFFRNRPVNSSSDTGATIGAFYEVLADRRTAFRTHLADGAFGDSYGTGAWDISGLYRLGWGLLLFDDGRDLNRLINRVVGIHLSLLPGRLSA